MKKILLIYALTLSLASHAMAEPPNQALAFIKEDKACSGIKQQSVHSFADSSGTKYCLVKDGYLKSGVYQQSFSLIKLQKDPEKLWTRIFRTDPNSGSCGENTPDAPLNGRLALDKYTIHEKESGFYIMWDQKLCGTPNIFSDITNFTANKGFISIIEQTADKEI